HRNSGTARRVSGLFPDLGPRTSDLGPRNWLGLLHPADRDVQRTDPENHEHGVGREPGAVDHLEEDLFPRLRCELDGLPDERVADADGMRSRVDMTGHRIAEE